MKLNLEQLIRSLLNDLDGRSRNILKRRYGLGSNYEGETLASLGKEFGVTRERVRQIETQALLKLKDSVKAGIGEDFFNKIKADLVQLGGVRRLENLALDLSREFGKGGIYNNLFFNQIKFLLESASWPNFNKGDNNFYSVWYGNKTDLDKCRNFCRSLKESLHNQKKNLLENGRWDKVFIGYAKSYKITEGVGLNYVSACKNFSVNSYGDFGLSSWSEIRPKTMRDKAYLVLKKERKPLHFLGITKSINKVNFDDKIAHSPTVHNELIRDKRFVLVGRGMYGLREQGFLPGTARDTLLRLLSSSGPMEKDKLVSMVLLERFLKPNTIFLNLQNRKYFRRLSDGRYTVA